MGDLDSDGKRESEDMSYKFNGKLKINGVEGKTPFLIGVAGGTASGKSTVCKRIMEKLGQVDVDHTERQVITISQDSFYRELSPAEKEKAAKGLFNFDHPDAIDDELILKTMKDILAGKKCEIPVYDYVINSRYVSHEWDVVVEAQAPVAKHYLQQQQFKFCDYNKVENQFTTIYPADVVFFEGILVFYFPQIRDLFHMKLFVDTDSDTRLARRVPRDIKERGRDLDQVLHQYMNFVKPAFEDFCMPTKKFADVIIPRGADNSVAIDLIVQHIRDFLNNRNTRSVEMPVPPSPAASPVHGSRRNTTHESSFLSRPH